MTKSGVVMLSLTKLI